MSINASSATPARERHSRWGKFYWGIDFDINNELRSESIREGAVNPDYSPTIGKLQLNNHEFEITEKEARRIIETLNDTLAAVKKSYGLGMLR